MANTATSLYFNDGASGSTLLKPVTNFGRGDYTIECWMNVSFLANDYIWSWDASNSLALKMISATELHFLFGDTDAPNRVAVTIPAYAGTWIHVACGMTGNGTHWVFVNGELQGTTYLADRNNDRSGETLYLMGASAASVGYLDAFRISKVARYGNIDIPTTQLNTWQVAGRGQNALLPHHVKLLIQANSTTTTSTTMFDESGHYTVAGFGGQGLGAHSQTETNFGNTSIYFDGTRQVVASGQTWVFGTKDFSIELWLNPTGQAGERGIINNHDGNDATNWSLKLTDVEKPYFFSGNDGFTLTAPDSLILGVFSHVAIVRVNGFCSMYVNGQMVAAGALTQDFSESNNLYIGYDYQDDSGGNSRFLGYMDGIRLCAGQSAYTPNFVPYGGQKNVAVSSGGAVTDARHPSANTHAIRMGQAITATNANTYCLDFDGTADYLLHKSPAWNAADTQGTIVAWIYNDDVSGDENIFGSASSAGTHTYLQLLMGGNKLEVHQVSNDTTADISGGTTLSADTWYMVALTSTGSGTGTYALYVNGAAESLTVNSGTNNGDWLNVTSALARTNIAIGSRVDSSADTFFNGKIMQVAYFGGSSSTTGVLTAAQLLALYNAGKGHDFTTATGVYTATETAALKGYWRMGNHHLDSAGDVTIHDASGYGADMHGVSMGGATGGCLTWTTGTTFLEGWQDRGYFTGDKYTSLLIQSAHANGSTTFTDSGPGFKKTLFDGAADYASATVTDWQPSDTQGTIIAWVKNDTIAGDDTVFASSDTAGATTFIKFQTAAGKISIEQKNNDTVDEIQGSTAVTAGLWNCLAWQSTGTGYKLYVNGVAETTLVQTGLDSGDWFADTSTADRNNISIGALITNAVGDYFDGQIAQVAVWGGASGTTGILTAAEILAIHDLGPGADLTTSYATGMVGYWTFGNKTDEGDDYVTHATTIYDQSTGSNDDLTGVSLAAPVAGHTVTYIGAGISGTDGVIATHKANKSVFGGSSMYFNGTDSEIGVTSPNWSGLDIGTGDFCMEMWINPDDNSNGRIMVEQTDGSNYWEWLYSNVTYGITFQQYGPSSTLEIRFDGMGNNLAWMVPGTWYHIAFTRSDGVMNWYRDGIIHNGTTATNPAAEIKNFAKLRIGGSLEGAYWAGYMDEIRFSVGTPRYTPSIERYANTFVAKGDTGDAYTVLQIQSNGSKSGAGYSDGLNRTGYNTSASGGPQNVNWLSSGGDPLGGANTALYFYGSVGTLTFADHADFNMVAGQPWTFEAWIRPEWDLTATNNRYLISHGADGVTGYAINFNDLNVEWEVYSGSAYNIPTTANGMSQGQWYHWAFCLTGTGYVVYRDGVLLVAGTTTGHIASVDAGNSFSFGGDRSGTAGTGFLGYMDQIRLSKGIARYGGVSLRTAQQVVTSSNSDTQVVTSNSTFGTGEATVPFGSDSYTALLLNGDEVYGGTATFTATKGGSGTGPVGAAGTVTITKGDGSTATTYPAQRQGVSAFGANSYYFDGGDYLIVPYHADFLLAGACTFEVWVNLTSIGAQQGIMELGSDGNDGRRLIAFHNSDGFLTYGATPVPAHNINTGLGGIQAGAWHHVAVTRDSENVLSIFLDGNLKSSVGGISGNLGIASRVITLGAQYNNSGTREEYFTGYMDSARISTGIARYEYTGTNTKLGLNAVHPSHAKLLITSNTYNGNTHFDDFSDQGNYWNQTPENYHFDGTDDFLGGTPVGLAGGAGVNRSVALWFKQYKYGEDSANYIFQFGDDTWGGGNQLGMWIWPDSTHMQLYNMIHSDGNAPVHQHKYELDTWNLAVATFTNASPSVQRIYLNGILGTSTNGTVTIDMGTPTKIRLNRTNDGTGTSGTAPLFMSQAGFWDGHLLTDAEVQAMWELGPAGDWTIAQGTGLKAYYGMGNHNELGGRPADTATACYDRVGTSDLTASGTMYAPHKGNLIIPAGNVKHSTDVKNFGSSAIYFDTDDDYLQIPNNGQFTTSSDFTLEFWLNTTDSGSSAIFDFRDASNGNNLLMDHINTTSLNFTIAAAARIFTPPSVSDGAWHHVVVQRNSGSSWHFLWDGKELSPSSGTGTMTGELTTAIATTGVPLIIGENYPSTAGYEGYLDEIGFYRVAKYTAVALPGEATITPSYLPDPSGNHFTTTGLAITDQMLDTPENNFCTLNPLHKTGGTYTEGNLKVVTESSTYKQYYGTMGMSTGKWYWECKIVAMTATFIGISGDHGQAKDASGTDQSSAGITGGQADSYAYGLAAGTKKNAPATGTSTHGGLAYGDTATTNDVIGMIVDLDNGKIWWSNNGVVQANGDPVAGTGEAFDTLLTNSLYTTGAHYLPAVHTQHDGATGTYYMNFGQGDPDGENNFTDSNGRGGFRFEPPSGFLSLCTANMKDADYAPIGPNSAAGASDQHFDTVLYEGTHSSGPQRIGGLNFQPDLVWIKTRNQAQNHVIFDSLRGNDLLICPNTSAAEALDPNALTSFNPDGFSLGVDTGVNYNAKHHVAWCWKAGNGSVEDTSGDIAVTRSTNVEAGFSIISYTQGSTATGTTIAHGLGKRPDFFIHKSRNQAYNWDVWHTDLVDTAERLKLNSADDSENLASTDWNPTATTIATGGSPHHAATDQIVYVWTSIEGFSKFGSYYGNNDTDGAFVYLGFKPALLIIKGRDNDARQWTMYSNKIMPYNGTDGPINFADASTVEDSSGNHHLDFLSNGFKVRNVHDHEGNAETYIYMAWAEMPFKYATGR